jgi:hypothetical protein
MAASIFLGIAETLRANHVPLQIVTVHATPESGPAGP